MLDRWASRLVISGGIIIIAAILAILVVIASEVYPLFKQPTATFLGAYSPAAATVSGSSPAPGSSAGVDEYREVAFEVSGAGVLEFASLKGKRDLASVPVPGLDGSRVTAVAGFGKGRHVIGTSDGRVIPLEMRFEVVFKDGTRTVTPQPIFGTPSALDPATRGPSCVSRPRRPNRGP